MPQNGGNCEGRIQSQEACNGGDICAVKFPCATDIALKVDMEDSSNAHLNAYKGKYTLKTTEMDDSQYQYRLAF